MSENPWRTPWSADEPGLCGCRRCVDERAAEQRAAGAPIHETLGSLSRFIVCEHCGNKRCPHATDHELSCTGSNEPNQPGSAYQTPPPLATGETWASRIRAAIEATP